MQVYAVCYESLRFLIGLKLEKGYYFYDASTGKGALVPRGQRLNGAGKRALPGGKLEEGETIEGAARREFFEETNASVEAAAVTTHKFSEHFAAAYFRLTSEEFDKLTKVTIETNLPQGLKAMDEVIQGKITEYSQIHERFEKAPRDNELATADVWSVEKDWPEIEKWKNDPQLGWYYDILLRLK